MTPTTAETGSAARWGPPWGDRPDDWAAGEEQRVPADLRSGDVQFLRNEFHCLVATAA